MWIFASAKVGGTTYLVVAGQFVDRAKPAIQMVDGTGALLAYDATGCQMIGPPREVFDYGADQAPPAVLDTLAKDAARRYMIAAGNKRALDRLVGRALAKAPPSLSKAFGDELGR